MIFSKKMALPFLRIPSSSCCSIPFINTKPQSLPSKTLRKSTELQTPVRLTEANDYRYPSGDAPTHKVTVHDRQRGVVHEFLVPEDQYILHTAESQNITLPFACRHGCCTSCAVRIKNGKIKQPEALGISAETLFTNPSNFTTLRHRSSRATGKLYEIDTSSSSSSNSLSSEGEHEMTLKLFDDLIHRILVKKATPDWLPFVPGSSFWVPPRPTPSNVVHLVHKLTDDERQSPFENDESLSISSLRGWPSSNYFIKGTVHGGDSGVELKIPEGIEGPVKVKVLMFPENLAHSEDEDEP